MVRTVIYKNYPIEINKKLGMKNIYIRVKNNTLIISCPKYTTNKTIQKIIDKNTERIEKLIFEHTRKNQNNKIKYENNSLHQLWGKPHILIIKESKNIQTQILENKMIISTPNTSATNIEKLLNNSYRKELLKQIEIIRKEIEKTTGLFPQEIRIKNMKTRWGSCNTKEKRIWINLQLAKYDLECLKYVLTHEYIHLENKNHDKEFYAKLHKYYPQYLQTEKILNK